MVGKACSEHLRAGERDRGRSAQGHLQNGTTGREGRLGAGLQHTRPMLSTRHCGPGAGAGRAHSVLGDTVCLNRPVPGAGMKTVQFQGSQGHERGQAR